MPAGREAEVRPIDYPLSLELQEQIEILKSTRNAEEPFYSWEKCIKSCFQVSSTFRTYWRVSL